MQEIEATYDPDDNKLRLRAAYRLDDETYQAVKAAGFKWAPRQDLFVAPMWTPQREDLALELASGEIDDENTTLVSRAEDRAERFGGYQERRAQDAESARNAVSAIADNIPMGQPILVGHHSEARARRDANKIERGMQKAVKMWRTSKYWASRARGVVSSAAYKDRPDVRARRIKKLEAAERKANKERQKSHDFLKMWGKVEGEKAEERALYISNFDHVSHCFTLADYPRPEDVSQYEGTRSLWSALDDGICTASQARQLATVSHARTISWQERWLAHYEVRLAYERALLDAQGASDLLKKPKRPKQPPLLNYRADSIEIRHPGGWGSRLEAISQVEMTKAEFKRRYSGFNSDQKGTRTAADGSHRVRFACTGREAAPKTGYMVPKWNAVFLTDSKAHKRPEVGPADPKPAPALRVAPRAYQEPERTEFDDMADSLKAGVQVVSAPQLFVTPRDLARQAAGLLGIKPIGGRILEPSAGTGNLIRAAVNVATGFDCCRVVAVEINAGCVSQLKEMRRGFLYAKDDNFRIVQGDFMEQNGNLGEFDVVLMNPPFKDGADIRHIQHARGFLKPGGRLVSFCANGPRQREALKPLAAEWIDLPAGSFKSSGTGVSAALLAIDN